VFLHKKVQEGTGISLSGKREVNRATKMAVLAQYIDCRIWDGDDFCCPSFQREKGDIEIGSVRPPVTFHVRSITMSFFKGI
jgi:hypothetical protein